MLQGKLVIFSRLWNITSRLICERGPFAIPKSWKPDIKILCICASSITPRGHKVFNQSNPIGSNLWFAVELNWGGTSNLPSIPKSPGQCAEFLFKTPYVKFSPKKKISELIDINIKGLSLFKREIYPKLAAWWVYMKGGFFGKKGVFVGGTPKATVFTKHFSRPLVNS